MVVEWLTFEVDPSELKDWLAVEELVWSRFLASQPGFVRKEIWRGGARQVHAVIWWKSREHWKAIGVDEVAAVDARMGEWYRRSTCSEFELIRGG